MLYHSKSLRFQAKNENSLILKDTHPMFSRRFCPGSFVWRKGHCVAGRLSSTFGIPRPAAQLRIGCVGWAQTTWDRFVGEVPKFKFQSG